MRLSLFQPSLSSSIVEWVLPFSCSFAASWLGTWALRRWAGQFGLVDLPDERKLHDAPTPRGGGLAIFAGVVLATLVGLGNVSGPQVKLLLCSTAIVLIGLWDDRKPLPWQHRLVIQIGAAAVAVLTISPEYASPVWQCLAVLWIVALVNAFNMLDNMDALSAGVAWIVAAFALAFPVMPKETPLFASDTESWVIFLGAITGFLWFNWPPASIFMGDAGSTFLGFYLGVRSLDWQPTHSISSLDWTAPVCLLAVPCYDLITVVALRLWQRRSPFHADKQHLSHRLTGLGLSSRSAVRTIYLLALASGFMGLVAAAGSQMERWLVVGALLSLWAAVAAIEYVRHFKGDVTTPR